MSFAKFLRTFILQNTSEQLLQKLHFFLAFWSMNFDLSLLKNFHRVDVDKKILVRVQFLVKRVNSLSLPLSTVIMF